MMRDGIVQLAPYLVLVFFAAHFVAMFNWSGLGPILAINAAEQLRQINMPAPLLLDQRGPGLLLLRPVRRLRLGQVVRPRPHRRAHVHAAGHQPGDDHRRLPHGRFGHQHRHAR